VAAERAGVSDMAWGAVERRFYELGLLEQGDVAAARRRFFLRLPKKQEIIRDIGYTSEVRQDKARLGELFVLREEIVAVKKKTPYTVVRKFTHNGEKIEIRVRYLRDGGVTVAGYFVGTGKFVPGTNRQISAAEARDAWWLQHKLAYFIEFARVGILTHGRVGFAGVQVEVRST
jgi:hypothetical protein